jgi:hypothetical protein
MRWILPLFFLSSSLLNAVRAGSGYVFLSKDSFLFYVKDDEIFSPDKKQLLYFRKGNIFFTGETDSKQNIFLLSTSMDVTSAKLQMLYEKDNRQPIFSFRDRKLYSGSPESTDIQEKAELLHMERTGKWWAFYSSLNDTLLAYFEADSLPLSTAVITAYTLAVKYKLQTKLDVVKAQGPFVQSSFVSIKPVWGNVTANEWIWDGKNLRPRWNTNPNCFWTFDGQVVKQVYTNNIYEQYQWDGETFKPLWRTNRAQEWSYDGRIIKPIWDTDWANQYMIENRIVKPWSNVHSEKEWQVDGDIPIPLIILVISGIARCQ